MKTVIRLTGMLVLTMYLTACGSMKVAVNPDEISAIHDIAIIEVSEPLTYVGNDFGSIGAALGAVGGALVATSSNEATKSIDSVANREGFIAGKYLTEILQDELTKSGYRVRLISADREKSNELIHDYMNVDSNGADAVLDVAIFSIGYATEHPLLSPHWRPSSVIKVNLIDTQTNKKIYFEEFMYGYHNPFMSGTNIDAPKNYHFKNKKAMYDNDKLLIEGMRDSVRAVAKQVALKLSK